MIYPYRCMECAFSFEVIKSVKDIDNQEYCPQCKAEGKRYITPPHLYGISDWDKAEFNPGLGCVIKNSKHRKQVAKQMGVEEVGSEPIEKIHKHFDDMREKKRDLEWEKL